MPAYKLITFDVKLEAIEEIEGAMRVYIDPGWHERYVGSLWWTAKRQDRPGSYVTIVAVQDAVTDNHIVTDERTIQFLGTLYPKCIEATTFVDLDMVATSHGVPFAKS